MLISRNSKISILFSIIAMMASSNVSQADLVISSSTGTVFETDGYTGLTTESADMLGMTVTAHFADLSTESLALSATGVAGTGWSLTHVGGSTTSNPFTLTNTLGTSMTRLELHGGGSTTLFDRDAPPSTAGTAAGTEFVESSLHSTLQTINVHYFDAIQTTGSTPVGDIFAALEIEFSTGYVSGAAPFTFIQDTDTANSVLFQAVPETGTASILAIGGVMLATRRRRRITEVAK